MAQWPLRVSYRVMLTFLSVALSSETRASDTPTRYSAYTAYGYAYCTENATVTQRATELLTPSSGNVRRNAQRVSG